jgi:hypothetical protein
MAKFCFYSKNDSNQEPIGATEAQSKEEAIKFFSLTKMLPVEQFLTIFTVKEYSYGESYKTSNKQLLKG